jgi:hypothetical protein
MTDYYDYILTFIPLTILTIPHGLLHIGLPQTQSIILGSAIAATLVIHGLFINGPEKQ